MPIQTTPEMREQLRFMSDRLRVIPTPLIWFSRSGSGDQIAGVSAAFLDPLEAAAYAVTHTGETVVFPNGTQLQARFALADGLDRWLERARWTPSSDAQ
jgi:hypothetical protein